MRKKEEKLRQIIDRLFRLNVYLFPFFWLSVNALILLETVAFRGFVKKYLFFGLHFFIFIAVLSLVFARLTQISLSHKKEKVVNKQHYIFLNNFLKLSLPVQITIAYLLFKQLPEGRESFLIVDSRFVYPDVFMLIPIINIFFLLVWSNFFKTLFIQIDKTKSDFKKSLVIVTYLVLLVNLLLNGLVSSGESIYKNVVVFVKNPLKNYDWKMEKQLGSVYKYYKFVSYNTPENAVILHPKQQWMWPAISNRGFTRYFLFPRKFISEDEPLLKKEEVTHVFLIGNRTLDGKLEIDRWPNFAVPAKRVILYSRNGDGVNLIFTGDDKLEERNTELWGVIEVDNTIKW